MPFALFLNTFNPYPCPVTAFEFPGFNGCNYWPSFSLVLYSARCLEFYIAHGKRGRRNSTCSYDIAADVIYPRDRHEDKGSPKETAVFTQKTLRY